MLLQKENWRHGYNQIISDCRPNISNAGGTVLILCNPDADALSAARILSYAFRADKVAYQLRPCGGFQRLIQILKRMLPRSNTTNAEDDEAPQQDSTIRAIILLNLGATRNLQKALFTPNLEIPSGGAGGDDDENSMNLIPPLLNTDHTKVYVLDAHRPYHLSNVHAGKNVVIWNDYDHWHAQEGGVPSDGSCLSGEEESEDDDDSSDEGSEKEFEEENPDSEAEAEFEDEIDASVHDDEANGRDEVDPGYEGQAEGDIGNTSELDEDDTVDQERVRKRPTSSPEGETKRLRRGSDASVGEDDPFAEAIGMDQLQSQDSIRSKDDDDTSRTGTMTPTLSQSPQRQNRRDRIRIYYTAGSFYSSPIAFMAYTLLSTQLRHESVGDLLWLACIGVTDAYIHNRLDIVGYVRLATELQSHVHRVYPVSNGIVRRSANTFHAEDLYSNNDFNGELTKVGTSDNGKIVTEEKEFRFFCLRHTSLWDAMRLSPDVNTRMELWKNSGVKKLQEMLAKMGLPLAQCKQPYAFMRASVKRRLKAMVADHAEEFGLTNISYTGFIRVTGYKSLLSAGDMSLAITALLECEANTSYDGSKENDDSDDNRGVTAEEKEERMLIASFNLAYDALNSNGAASSSFSSLGGVEGTSTMEGEGSDLSNLVNGGEMAGSSGVGAGIRLAISLQKLIISTAVNLVERSAITRLSHFRYAYLHITSQGANGSSGFKSGGSAKATEKDLSSYPVHQFSKPLALTKLAHFLMDMHRANNKWTGTKARPLVLMAEKPQTQTYVVVGYEYPEERGENRKNRFGQNFEIAAKTMHGSFKFDSFESNVIEVKASDVQRFIEHLHYMMDSV